MNMIGIGDRRGDHRSELRVDLRPGLNRTWRTASLRAAYFLSLAVFSASFRERFLLPSI